MISSIIIFSLIALLIFTFSSAVGALCAPFILPKRFESTEANHLINHFLGMVVIILLYSIVVTFGKTIGVVMLLPLLAMFLANRGKRSEINLKKYISIPHLLIFGCVFILVSILSHFYNYSISINNDMLFYANIGKNIGFNGGENVYHYYNAIIPEECSNGTYPYHYFEFWFLSMLRTLFTEFAAIIVLKYLVYVYFKTYAVMGIVAVLRELNVKAKGIFVYPLVIFASLIPLDDFLNIFNAGWSYHFSIWTRPNFLTYIFVLIPFVLLIMKRQMYVGFLFLLFLPSISTVTAPVVFVFLSITVLALKVFKLINKSEFWKLAIFVFLTAMGIMLFYKILGVEIKSLTLTKDYIVEQYKITWKAMLFLTVVMVLTITALILPFSFLLKKMGDNKNFFQFLLLSSLALTVIGIVIFQLGNFIDNFYQFPYLGYSFVYLLIVLLLCWASFSGIRFSYFSIGIIVIGFIYSLGSTTVPNSMDVSKNNIMHQNIGQELDFDNLVENSKKIKGNGLLILDAKVIASIPAKKRDLLSNQHANYLYYIDNSITLLPYVSDSIFYKESSQNDDFSKAHIFNDILPSELFNANPNQIKQVIEKYDISFLFISGKENWDIYSSIFSDAKYVKINENQKILLLGE